MNEFLVKLENALSTYAKQFTPEGSEIKAVVHQWVHATAYDNDIFASSKGADKNEVLTWLKKAKYYRSVKQFKKELRDCINLNPAEKPEFSFIDLFAGIGGMRQGFESAGGSCVFSSEFDKHAQDSYYENYGEYPFGDITKIANEQPGDANWIDAIPKHDVLVGGFPCQAFSIAGYRHGFNDKKGRGNLFFRMAEIIYSRRPKAFLLENVKNLVGHDKGNTMKVIQETITKDLGYSFIPFVLNATDHGNVPQNRERIYIVGFKDESAYHAKDKTKLKDVLTHQFQIPEAIRFTKTIFDVLHLNQQKKRYYYPETHQYYDELNSAMTSKETVYQWRRVYVRENKSNVCPTLTANMGTGGHNVPLIRDDFGIRKLVPEECVGFQGFIDEFKFPKNMAMSHRYKQAGNSVVVPVVSRIAFEIARLLKGNAQA